MILIKCCDISNEVRPTEVAEPWVDCLLEEYFMQVRTGHGSHTSCGSSAPSLGSCSKPTQVAGVTSFRKPSQQVHVGNTLDCNLRHNHQEQLKSNCYHASASVTSN